MELSVFILIAFVFFVVGGVIHNNATRKWRAVLGEIAERYGLTYQPAATLDRRPERRALALDATSRKHLDRAAGEVDGFEVIVDSFTSSEGESTTTYSRVRVLSDLPRDLELSPEGAGSFFGKAFRGPDVVVGDDAFDAEAYIRGDEVEIVARMNATARAATRTLLPTATTVVEGILTYQREGRYSLASDAVVAIDALLDFARAARRDRPLPSMLADNAADDPLPTVRVRNLELLAARYPDHPETARAIATGLADDSPDVRLAAALIGDDAATRAALEALLADDTVATLARLTAAGRLAELDPSNALLAAHSPWIVAQLGSSEVAATLAAHALGHFADITAVEALLPHTRGVFQDSRLKDAARTAVAAIQARAPGTAGALSLADASAAGSLSLVADE